MRQRRGQETGKKKRMKGEDNLHMRDFKWEQEILKIVNVNEGDGVKTQGEVEQEDNQTGYIDKLGTISPRT